MKHPIGMRLFPDEYNEKASVVYVHELRTVADIYWSHQQPFHALAILRPSQFARLSRSFGNDAVCKRVLIVWVRLCCAKYSKLYTVAHTQTYYNCLEWGTFQPDVSHFTAAFIWVCSLQIFHWAYLNWFAIKKSSRYDHVYFLPKSFQNADFI